MAFIHNHKIQIPIDRIEKLSKGIEMVQHLEEGKQFGKIVLQPY
jgi:NADPH:quinone reductase-like Zn-dependent oxidoreductase